ncbi:MAG: hypothetical protein HQM11_07890 [SAR324 cluster bacterium]|nr:hypothetical protein [SAR324 cluster bacterium]
MPHKHRTTFEFNHRNVNLLKAEAARREMSPSELLRIIVRTAPRDMDVLKKRPVNLTLFDEDMQKLEKLADDCTVFRDGNRQTRGSKNYIAERLVELFFSTLENE